jgi:hypothetical protein
MDKVKAPKFTEIALILHAQLDVVEWLSRTADGDDVRTFRRLYAG